jgi:hypothetical protein
MYFHLSICFLLAALPFGPEALAAAPPTAVADTAAAVQSDDPVITLDGFCHDLADHDRICRTIVTRAQFEMLVEALQPDMSPSLRLRVANAYARNLKMSAAAERRGLDKTPAFAQEMEYARLQLLSQDLTRALQADADNITDAELENHYRENQASYQQATVARIYVPRGKHTDADAVTRVSDDLRERAVKGEDPDELQLDAYAQAGIPRTAASTRLTNVRRTTLPPAHETVLDLNPGEISEVFSDPAGAHFFYKMISKETLAYENVKAEIRGDMATKRYRDSMKTFQSDIMFNDAYFNPTSANAKRLAPRHRRADGPKAATQDHADD